MARTRGELRIIIAGLGNILLQDDGVGVHAVWELMKAPPHYAQPLDIGCAVFDALYYMERADRVLVIDAMQAGGEPGDIYHCHIDQITNEGVKASLHELGLVTVLNFLPVHQRPLVYVLGVEPEAIGFGLELSTSVAAVLPRVVQMAIDITAEWSKEEA